jgi:hypothetical protein
MFSNAASGLITLELICKQLDFPILKLDNFTAQAQFPKLRLQPFQHIHHPLASYAPSRPQNAQPLTQRASNICHQLYEELG